MADFTKTGIKKEISDVLTKLGFNDSLDVQEAIIPLALSGKNIVFTSRTGSGKTLAYLLGYLQKINRKQGLQMLVIVPTRELCVQAGKEMQKVCDYFDLKVGMLYGGREIAGDSRTTSRKNQIIIGTPGRLIQHINEKRVRVGEVKYLVFDESDQIFDDGFFDECCYVKSRVSKTAQIILSSATITNKVERFIEEEMGEYELRSIGEQIPSGIVQEKILCAIPDKNELLLKFFKSKHFKRAIIFCNTKVRTNSISEFLAANKIAAKPINGDLRQDERTNNLNLFRQGRLRVLVATDVAARGLHIENVDIVVNYDSPRQEEFYIHRIGRTGRNDKKGYSLTLLCPEDEKRFEQIEKLYHLKTVLIDEKFNKVE